MKWRQFQSSTEHLKKRDKAMRRTVTLKRTCLDVSSNRGTCSIGWSTYSYSSEPGAGGGVPGGSAGTSGSGSGSGVLDFFPFFPDPEKEDTSLREPYFLSSVSSGEIVLALQH